MTNTYRMKNDNQAHASDDYKQKFQPFMGSPLLLRKEPNVTCMNLYVGYVCQNKKKGFWTNMEILI